MVVRAACSTSWLWLIQSERAARHVHVRPIPANVGRLANSQWKYTPAGFSNREGLPAAIEKVTVPGTVESAKNGYGAFPTA